MTKKISCRVIKSVSLAKGISTATAYDSSSDMHNDKINNAIVLAVKVQSINEKGFKWPFYAAEERCTGKSTIGQNLDCYA